MSDATVPHVSTGSRYEPPLSLRDDARAVVIGINTYQDTRIRNLNFARADAEAVHAVLTNPEWGRFKPEHVTLLVDDAASQVGIKVAIETQLANRARPDDTVFVYYAGHGAPVSDLRGNEDGYSDKYLVPADARADALRSTGISMDEINRWFGWIRARQVVFFFDSCYSGGAGGRSFEVPGLSTRAATLVSDEYPREWGEEGRYIITACGAGQVSIEDDDLKQGIFTHYLLEGLQGKADADGDGLVTLDELFRYVSREVKQAATLRGGAMSPMQKGSARGTIYLTQYETLKQRDARESGEAARRAFDAGDFDDADRLWARVLDVDPDAQPAKNGRASVQAIRDRLERERDHRLRVLRTHLSSGDISRQLFAAAVDLLRSNPAMLSADQQELRDFVVELADGLITVSQYKGALETLALPSQSLSPRDAKEPDAPSRRTPNRVTLSNQLPTTAARPSVPLELPTVGRQPALAPAAPRTAPALREADPAPRAAAAPLVDVVGPALQDSKPSAGGAADRRSSIESIKRPVLRLSANLILGGFLGLLLGVAEGKSHQPQAYSDPTWSASTFEAARAAAVLCALAIVVASAAGVARPRSWWSRGGRVAALFAFALAVPISLQDDVLAAIGHWILAFAASALAGWALRTWGRSRPRAMVPPLVGCAIEAILFARPQDLLIGLIAGSTRYIWWRKAPGGADMPENVRGSELTPSVDVRHDRAVVVGILVAILGAFLLRQFL
jgi:uncharacterized caspase-like protein